MLRLSMEHETPKLGKCTRSAGARSSDADQILRGAEQEILSYESPNVA